MTTRNRTSEFRTSLSRRSLLALGSAGGLAALLPAGRLAAQVDGGTLVMTANPEPNTMVSAFNSADPVNVVSSKMVEGLVQYDFDLVPHPHLATGWEVAEDGLSITFHLREGVRWHDGQPFTSADVAFSLMEIIRNHHPRGRNTFKGLEAVETPDELTAVLRLAKPAPALMAALAGWETPILPRHVYEGTDYPTNPANTAPVGTGPYKFAEWQPGSHIIMTRNEDYWKPGKPHIERLVVRYYSDPGARTAAFETGELQLGGDGPIPLNDVKRFQTDPRFTVELRGTELNNSLDILQLNLREGPLSHVEVRRALLHALDRELMLDVVWYGLAEILTGPVPKTIPRFYTDDVPRYPYDPARAEELLEAAGFPLDGERRFTLRLVAPAIGDSYDRAGQFLSQQFRKVGVGLELRMVDVPTFIRMVYADYDFDIAMFPASVTADPSVGSYRFFHSSAISQGTPFVNASDYRNPEMDRVLDAAAVETDAAKRIEQMHEFQRIAMEDLPLLPLARPIYALVASSRVKDFLEGPEGIAGTLSEAWIEG